MKYDVIVAGGGISGLLSALVLGKHGKKILVIEQNKQPGGNCNSYNVDGFQVDTGVHAITHLQAGPLRKLMDDYFDYVPVFVDHGTYFVRTEKGLTKIPSNIKEFVTFDVLPRKDRLLLSQALTKAITLSTFGVDNEKQSVYDCLPNNLSRDAYDFVDALSYSLSGKSMKETSVHRILYGSSFVRDSVTDSILDDTPIQSQEIRSYTSLIAEHLTGISKSQVMGHLSTLGRLATNKISYAQGYPRGGLRALLNAVLYSLPETVEIKTESRVEKVLTDKEGRACGVATGDDTLYADTVVYAGFVKDLPGLVSGLPDEYRTDLGRIDQTRSLTIWIGLGKKIEEFKYSGSEIWFKGKFYWAMPISNYDARIAPRGKQLVGFTFVLDSSKTVESEKKLAYETILNAVPGIEQHIEMIHYQLTIPEKAAVTINGFFAKPRSPVQGLYLAGTDVDKRSMGITRAAYSVLEMLKMMKEDRVIGSLEL